MFLVFSDLRSIRSLLKLFFFEELSHHGRAATERESVVMGDEQQAEQFVGYDVLK